MLDIIFFRFFSALQRTLDICSQMSRCIKISTLEFGFWLLQLLYFSWAVAIQFWFLLVFEKALDEVIASRLTSTSSDQKFRTLFFQKSYNMPTKNRNPEICSKTDQA